MFHVEHLERMGLLEYKYLVRSSVIVLIDIGKIWYKYIFQLFHVEQFQ